MVIIFHAAKEGDFHGGQKNAHDVICIIEVKEGVTSGKEGLELAVRWGCSKELNENP